MSEPFDPNSETTGVPEADTAEPAGETPADTAASPFAADGTYRMIRPDDQREAEPAARPRRERRRRRPRPAPARSSRRRPAPVR